MSDRNSAYRSLCRTFKSDGYETHPHRTVRAVGIELKMALKARKLVIPRNQKNPKNRELAQVRYTAGTNNDASRLCALIVDFDLGVHDRVGQLGHFVIRIFSMLVLRQTFCCSGI